jgi:glycosyltransferase involved in cell wall biosynthesis
MDKITIIIVCYNETPERIGYTLDSVVRQNYSSMECIIVDGGSNSATIDAFEPYHIKITKFISEPDKGIYDAMNKGIRISTGDWIIFMNIGDRFHNFNVLTSMMTQSINEYGDIICGDILRDGKARLFYPQKITKRYLCYHSICHQAVFARRSLFDLVGTFDTSFHLVADRDWIFRVIKERFIYRHFAVIVCDWEIGGACNDQRIEENELKIYRSKYFTLYERILYKYLWLAQKVIERIKSLNFNLPVKLKELNYNHK